MDVFEAVAEPSRRALLDALTRGERTAGELVATLKNGTEYVLRFGDLTSVAGSDKE